ncbi:Hypothetical predicted protein [Podarcis lilfordi]|uniref:Uncharacterized protein n=1 Tax=Podarcis lilfordi TaxID=74358 RepID=A0AA35LEB1_9SAUR|nr:Hypothetical predicted protein [Podarcis lilfordi]
MKSRFLQNRTTTTTMTTTTTTNTTKRNTPQNKTHPRLSRWRSDKRLRCSDLGLTIDRRTGTDNRPRFSTEIKSNCFTLIFPLTLILAILQPNALHQSLLLPAFPSQVT